MLRGEDGGVEVGGVGGEGRDPVGGAVFEEEDGGEGVEEGFGDVGDWEGGWLGGMKGVVETYILERCGCRRGLRCR